MLTILLLKSASLSCMTIGLGVPTFIAFKLKLNIRVLQRKSFCTLHYTIRYCCDIFNMPLINNISCRSLNWFHQTWIQKWKLHCLILVAEWDLTNRNCLNFQLEYFRVATSTNILDNLKYVWIILSTEN